MTLFKQWRPLIRIAVALEQIAHALTYFASTDAMTKGRMFTPIRKGWLNEKDESEILYTDSDKIAKRRHELEELAAHHGFKAMEEAEERPSEDEEWLKLNNS